MKNKEIILLMAAMTEGGKTTNAIALTHPECRKELHYIVNNRTQVTTDWTYVPNAKKIKLVEVHLNYKAIFGTENKNRFTCEKFNEILDGEKEDDSKKEGGKFLKDFFGFEKLEGLNARTAEEIAEILEKYIENKINEFVNNCNNVVLKKLLEDDDSSRFIRRIKVILPPVEWLKDYLEEKKVVFVLRDTRGLLDIKPEEAKSIQTRSMNELGLDGIDAVLLMGTPINFPEITGWYKNAYKEAFEAVPVFIMARSELVLATYETNYVGNDEILNEAHINLTNVNDFLENVKKANGAYRRFPDSYISFYRLLEKFDVGKLKGEEFEFNYKVYDNEQMRYVSSNAKTLALDSEPDYESAEYRLFELILFVNIRDMLEKIIQHIGFTEAIMKQIKNDFAEKVQEAKAITMWPKYTSDKNKRENVNENILDKDMRILGPRGGIVTVDHGKILYLGAVTSGVTSREWLRQMVYSYEYREKLGQEIAPQIPEENKKNLIRMALLNLIAKNTDFYAYFQGYYFMNRDKIYEAIDKIRNIGCEGDDDALTSASKEIASLVLG